MLDQEPVAPTAQHATRQPRTPKRGVVSRRVLPFAPVALALAQSLVPGPTATAPAGNPSDFAAAVCVEGLGSSEECHSQFPTGCSKAAKYDGYLNHMKNLVISPTLPPARFLAQKDFASLDLNTPADLLTNNHSQFADALKTQGEGTVVGVIGYLYYAQPGGKSESANCQLGDPSEIDFHIGIGFDPALADKVAAKKKLTPDDHKLSTTTSIIVEMTPHWRARFEPDWSLDVLKKVLGHQVKVVGQLLIDNEHHDTKDDCALAGANPDTCWRASVWELHPVTQFQVCQSTSPCPENSGDWKDLADLATESNAPAAAPAPITG